MLLKIFSLVRTFDYNYNVFTTKIVNNRNNYSYIRPVFLKRVGRAHKRYIDKTIHISRFAATYIIIRLKVGDKKN